MTHDPPQPPGLFRNPLDKAMAARAPVQMQIALGAGERASDGQRVPLVLLTVPGRAQPIPFGLDECRGLGLQLLEAAIRAQIAFEADPAPSIVRPA